MSQQTADTYVLEILRLEALLRAYLHRFAPKAADLEDLLRETYLRLLRLPPDQRVEVRALQSFALTTARGAALEWMRRRRVVPIDLVEDLDTLSLSEDAQRVEAIVNAHREVLRLAHAVADLPTRSAEVFTLRKVYGWSHDDIAQHLSMSLTAVETHLVKAVRHCTQCLNSTPPAVHRSVSWFGRWRRKGQRG